MHDRNVKVIGISGSLRNARFGRGSDKFIEEIKKINNFNNLQSYLKKQTKIRAQDYFTAGEREGKPFDQIYRVLQKAKGDKGLSNSEASLAAGLWGACNEGVDIGHVGLSIYFPMSGKSKNLIKLKKKIIDADALLISGPVYFGDRGSPIHEFIEFLSSDPELREHFRGKVYAGISVGAKRNGGQETNLIYQIIDMSNLNMLTLGNSSSTTSQYGGTVVAGDIGSAWSDEDGLDTAIGTGERVANVAKSLVNSQDSELKGKLRVGVWVMQDTKDKTGLEYLQKIITEANRNDVEFDIIDVTEEKVARCIACDLCPTHHAPRDEYACIIGTKDDFFVKDHARLVNTDAILMMSYSPIDRSKLNSVYQRFIERTRYIRRANYGFSELLAAPFVISEINANQNLHIRMLTSLVRHHTILHHPVIAYKHENEIINYEYCMKQFNVFLDSAIKTTCARLLRESSEIDTEYNPLGYIISKERNKTDKDTGKMNKILERDRILYVSERNTRLKRI